MYIIINNLKDLSLTVLTMSNFYIIILYNKPTIHNIVFTHYKVN